MTVLWQHERVRRYALGTLVFGLVGAVILCVSIGSTHWLVFPPGHFYIKTHRLYMGIWGDRACVSDQCGFVPNTELRANTTAEWNGVVGLMCTTVAFVFIGTSLNIIVLVSPRKIFTVLCGLFWLLSGAMNMVTVVIFWHYFKAYDERMGWSYWICMISTIIFYVIGFIVTIFSCCHRWTNSIARNNGAEDPITVAPPPVVSYRSEATTSDGKPHTFEANNSDMQPNVYGGKPYDTNHSGPDVQSYHI